LVGFEEAVLVNGTGLDVSAVRSVTPTNDGILVNATIDAPRVLSSGGVTFADMNDPARGKSVFQARYQVYWLRRLRLIDKDGVPYDVDNPFNPAGFQLPAIPSGSVTPFLVFAQTRGPDTVRIRSVTVEKDPDGVFEMAPVSGLAVPPGYAADLSGTFKPLRPGIYNAKIVILRNDPGNNRIVIWVNATAL
jgi:hypothetical protein